MTEMYITAGTAGHIDHGKTSLVRALTGTDADRLPEEKLRGITIDLGFAELDLGEVHVGFVDVPGHERFIKNMLAGASGIDLMILVVAADEGVMPQTREHFEICRLLGVSAGLTVLTKSDLVDKETVELVKLELSDLLKGSFLETSPMIECSSKTGEGIQDVKDSILSLSSEVRPRTEGLSTRLPIDRSFTVKGFGAVVTGTLASGSVRDGDELVLMPDGEAVRVRGIQTHGSASDMAKAGRRTALNLGGIDHASIVRGMTLCEPGCFQPSQIVDASLEMLDEAAPIKSRQRVRVHIGTAEVLARIHLLQEEAESSSPNRCFAQLRFELPVVCVPGERFIIRTYSPQTTVAGGVVVDNLAAKHKRSSFETVAASLSEMSVDDVSRVRVLIRIAGQKGMTVSDLKFRTGCGEALISELLTRLETEGSVSRVGSSFMATSALDVLCSDVLTAVAEHHKQEPLSKGMTLAALREGRFKHSSQDVFKSVVERLVQSGRLVLDKETLSLEGHGPSLSPQESELLQSFRTIYSSAGLEAPKLDEVISEGAARSGVSAITARKIFQMLIDSRELVKISDEFYFRTEDIEKLKVRLREHAAASNEKIIDVGTFKTVAGLSRKYAIPILEFFDREKVTRRVGNARVVL